MYSNVWLGKSRDYIMSAYVLRRSPRLTCAELALAYLQRGVSPESCPGVLVNSFIKSTTTQTRDMNMLHSL